MTRRFLLAGLVLGLSLSAGTPRPAARSTELPSRLSVRDFWRLVVDSSASQASYHAREQLVGKTLPSDAVGTSKSVSGSLVVGADGSVLADQDNVR